MLTYGLIAGGVVLAGAAMWYLSGSEVDVNNLTGGKINQFDFKKVHTVERLREILELYALDSANILIWSYNTQLKMKENDPEIMSKIPCPETSKDRTIAKNDELMDEALQKLLDKYADNQVNEEGEMTL